MLGEKVENKFGRKVESKLVKSWNINLDHFCCTTIIRGDHLWSPGVTLFVTFITDQGHIKQI